MQYKNVCKARFIERPNRFIALCEVAGEIVKSHVRNTGRLRELLWPGVTVYLECSSDEKRKTGYSLIAVEKGKQVVNIDSSAPNKVLGEALSSGRCILPGLGPLTLIKPESCFAGSRFDFYLETAERKAYAEVKGVTLEENGSALFPDAPTERGLRHVEELIKAKKEGFEAFVIFVVQMKGISSFSPNRRTQAAFGDALETAKREGVNILCYDCTVSPDSIVIHEPLPVILI